MKTRHARRPSRKVLGQVRDWNASSPLPPYQARYWPGERSDETEPVLGTVYTRAHLLSGITPVVFIAGVGAVALTHVEPVR